MDADAITNRFFFYRLVPLPVNLKKALPVFFFIVCVCVCEEVFKLISLGWLIIALTVLRSDDIIQRLDKLIQCERLFHILHLG